LWQDWPVKVKISHFLVSNVQSKFYRLDLDLDLDLLVFFFKFKATKKFQYFEFLASCPFVGGCCCPSATDIFFTTNESECWQNIFSSHFDFK